MLPMPERGADAPVLVYLPEGMRPTLHTLTPAGGALMADLLLDEVVGIGRLPAGSTLRVAVTAGAPAAALNLTVTWPRQSGYLTVWPAGEPQPAGDRPGVGECRRVDHIEPIGRTAGVGPHIAGNRVAGQGQRLPGAVREE